MEQTETSAIIDALKRIDRCLDERFEKNADLYITSNDVEKLKKLIYAGQYTQIVDKFKFKKLLPEVLANVLIKNAWLMKNNKFSLLYPIFNACDFRYLSIIMKEGVFDNKIEMPSDFRLNLIEIFLSKADAYTCQQILDLEIPFLNRPELRAVCLCQVLKEETSLNRYEMFSEFVDGYPSLLTQSNILKKVFAAEALNQDVMDEIFENDFLYDTKACAFWTECISADDAKYIFAKIPEYCRRYPTRAVKPINQMMKYMFDLARKDAANNIPLLAEYFAKGCDCLDGKSKITLAEKGLARAKKNEAVFFLQAMNKYNLKVQKKELASKEKMIEIMNEGFLHPNAYRYLVHSFNKQYADDYKNVLFELEEEVPEDVFEEFCCQLVLNTERNLYINLRYLRYVIEYQIPDYADADDKIVGRILKHIENHDILNRCKNMAGINEVKLFVKEKDFDMYSRLVHF